MKKIRILAAAAAIALMLFSGGRLLFTYLEYEKGTQLYRDAAEEYVSLVQEPEAQKVPSTLSEEESGNSSTASVQQEHPSDAISYPEADVPLPDDAPLRVDFDALQRKNPDAVAWLYGPGTEINYPVMQGEDNSTYLRRMLDGTYSISGSLFMDYRCPADCSGLHTIIYGHNMKNSAMFGTLPKYAEQSYYEDHPFLWLCTGEGNYRIELLAGVDTPKNGPYYAFPEDENAMRELLADALAESDFQTHFDPDEVTRLLTLSTCSDDGTMRYVVIGALVPEA